MLRTGAAAALLGTLGACAGGDATLPCRDQISVVPTMLLLGPGTQGKVRAQVAGANGCQPVGSAVRWDAQDTAIARVQADTGSTATVTGVAAGSTFVIATLLADTTSRAATLVQVGPAGPPGQQ